MSTGNNFPTNSNYLRYYKNYFPCYKNNIPAYFKKKLFKYKYVDMPSLDKMSSTNGEPMPHTGEMIGARLKELHVSNAALSRLLDVPPSSVARYYQQHTIHAALLWKMGLVLEYNFFADLAAAFPVASTVGSVREEALERTIADLRQELMDARKENETLMKVLRVKG